MMPAHHPREETLLQYLAGTLDEGQNLVVAAHIEMCASCRRLAFGLEAAGGDYLQSLPPTPMADDSLEKILARLDKSPIARPVAPAQSPHDDLPVRLRALAPYKLNKWHWIGPGVHLRTVTMPETAKSRVFLLKSAPRTKLPQHSHDDSELTLVLKGAFQHAGGRFAAGDCDDADDSIEHAPVVEDGEDCICLVAMQGYIRLSGLMGRILQPLVRL